MSCILTLPYNEFAFLLHAEREPSNARLPKVSEYDFTLHTDGRNYNIDVRIFFNRFLNVERKVSKANLSRVVINLKKPRPLTRKWSSCQN